MKNIIALAITSALMITPVMAAETVMTSDQASQLVKIEKTPLILTSHLAKRFSAYKVTVNSKYPGNLDLKSASIDNGVPGTIAADSTATSYVNILWGLPLWLLGMGVAAFVISGKNHKAETEGYQFTNQIPGNTLHKNDSISFNALVPVGQTPQVKIRFEDENTGLTFAANQ